MIKWLKRKEPLVDIDELNRQTAEVEATLEREGPRMNALAAYLERRKGQNGFGEDFEITLIPRAHRNKEAT